MHSNGKPRWINGSIVRGKRGQFLSQLLYRCARPQADEGISVHPKRPLILGEIIQRKLGVGPEARAEHLALYIAIGWQILYYRRHSHRMRRVEGSRYLGSIRA